VLLTACSTSDSSDSAVDASGPSDASTTPSDGGCRKNADCAYGSCLLPGQDFLPSCGGPPPTVECSTSADCVKASDAGADADSDGGTTVRVCQPAACFGRVCAPPCKQDKDCPLAAVAPSVCDVATGVCLRARCTPSSCGTDSVCNPAVGCDHPKSCSSDAECAGACVTGLCVSGPGHCAIPPPPPP
jgi:hypothetical protein